MNMPLIVDVLRRSAIGIQRVEKQRNNVVGWLGNSEAGVLFSKVGSVELSV